MLGKQKIMRQASVGDRRRTAVQPRGVTATIVGTVTDATGAVIADSSVQVRNVGTGIAQGTTSDAQGRYRVPDLLIGEYEVQATKAGFQTVVHRGVTLTVGSQPVVDFQLPVGQAQQTVTVESEVSQVETQSTDVGALVESKQVTELPLNDRSFTQLLTLAPGSRPDPARRSGRRQHILRQRPEVYDRGIAPIRTALSAG